MKKIISSLTFIFLFAFLVVFSPVFAQNKPEQKKSYIVVLKDDANADVSIPRIAAKHGVSTDNEYKNVIKGFSATLSMEQFRNIAKDPDVAFISDDKEV